MSYEVFPVPFVGPISTVVNWLVDGVCYVILEPTTRLLSDKIQPLPQPTPWEVLSQAGPQRQFLQDMKPHEIFFQSCYVLFRGAIQV
jgi:hypothetical protein